VINCDRRQSNYVDSTCDGRHSAHHAECPPLCIADAREAARRAGPSATVDSCFTTRSFATADRATRYVSQNFVNFRNQLYNKSVARRSKGVRQLQLTDLY